MSNYKIPREDSFSSPTPKMRPKGLASRSKTEEPEQGPLDKFFSLFRSAGGKLKQNNNTSSSNRAMKFYDASNNKPTTPSEKTVSARPMRIGKARAELDLFEELDVVAPGVITVASGDTLSAIARDNNTTVAEIQKANPIITNPDRINIGQDINIPSVAKQQDTSTLKGNEVGLMAKPTSSSQKEVLSDMGSDVNKATAYPIEIPTSTGVASNIYSRLELNNALDKSISNPFKKALLQGTMDIEVGNQGPVTESAYYRLSKARKMFNSASVNRALTSLSSADRQRANKNLPVEALGLALFDDVYDGGSNYRGRGLIQITGLSNYRAVQDKLAEDGINIDLVNKPELVNNTKYALPAALAFLDYAGLNDKTANTMSTKKLNNLINSGANAKIANKRWDSVISALKSAGKKEEAADMALRNEYKAQKKVGVTQDGSIGPISRKAMLSWLDKKDVTVRPDSDDDMELVKLVNRTK